MRQINLSAARIACALGAVAFLLVLASVAGQLMKYWAGRPTVYGLVALFNVETEWNIPTFYSVFLLLFAALLLAVITILERKERPSDAWPWAILSLGFVLMGVDDAWAIHETFNVPVKNVLGGTYGLFYFGWVVPGMAIVVIVGLVFLRFLLRLPYNTRFTFALAASLFIGGAIGVELIGSHYVEFYDGDTLTYNMIATVEESLEMAGVIVFIYALLRYASDNYKEVRFRIDN